MALDGWPGAQEAVFEDEHRWGEIRLRRRVYLTARAPPSDLASSVRAVVFRRQSVAVIRDGQGSGHVMPGGRIEPGESWDTALRREVLEECGWRMDAARQFAVLHFHHLTPKPEGYRYFYPDFLQPVFVAEAVSFHRAALKRAGEIETGSRMVPIRRALATLDEGQRVMLRAALVARA
ncbi:MAG TPA: NUDIX domain-containing protein [Caulobacteraceae bacterium]|nr:NUDIX domain-containing protein [Caulobacteraceae bacterium]